MTHTAPLSPAGPWKWLSLAAFIVVVLAVGSAIGATNTPGVWYEELEKPFFNPPDWIFAPVWTTLYVLIAIAGWRIFRRAPKSLAMGLWVAQMLLNWAWSPAFFGAENLALALAIILPMLATIIGFIIAARKHDSWAPWLFMPYAAWVGFATLLNLSLLILN